MKQQSCQVWPRPVGCGVQRIGRAWNRCPAGLRVGSPRPPLQPSVVLLALLATWPALRSHL
eukprot:8792229-Alexandrium_andersonii.AAC.1